MKPLNICASWDEEANVWVATSDEVLGLAIEASTMDALIERLQIVISELLELNHSDVFQEDVPFVLESRFCGKISCHIKAH